MDQSHRRYISNTEFRIDEKRFTCRRQNNTKLAHQGQPSKFNRRSLLYTTY